MHSYTPPRGLIQRPHPSSRVTTIAELTCSLQDAVNLGDVDDAAVAAAQLARQRAPVIIQRTELETNKLQTEHGLRMKVHIEDRETDAGYVYLTVLPDMSVRALKNKIFIALGFPPDVQKWIINNRLPKDDEILADIMELVPGASLFLYLMSARSVGLTRKGFQEKHLGEFSHAGISNLLLGQDNTPPMQRSMSVPQTNTPESRPLSQGHVISQGHTFSTGHFQSQGDVTDQGHSPRQGLVRSPGHSQGHVPNQGQPLNEGLAQNQSNFHQPRLQVLIPPSQHSQFQRPIQFQSHVGQGFVHGPNSVQNPGPMSSHASPVVSQVQHRLWLARNQQIADKWVCDRCTLENSIHRSRCEACDNQR